MFDSGEGAQASDAGARAAAGHQSQTDGLQMAGAQTLHLIAFIC